MFNLKFWRNVADAWIDKITDTERYKIKDSVKDLRAEEKVIPKIQHAKAYVFDDSDDDW